MSDNIMIFRTIRNALNKLYPYPSEGNVTRHVTTLAWMISGIVGSHSTHLPKIAGKAPDGNKVESRVKRFSRRVKNEKIETELYFMPFAQALLLGLTSQTLVLAIDGSVIGRGCMALMVNVIYTGRALPIASSVVKGKKGHLPEALHIDLIEHVKPLVSAEADVVFLGDGEFHSVDLQRTITKYHWDYVCRTGDNIKVFAGGQELSCAEVACRVQPGERISLSDVLFTHEEYGPVTLIGWWRKGYREPILLVTNMALAEVACTYYAKRFRIETFFSDQKIRKVEDLICINPIFRIRNAYLGC